MDNSHPKFLLPPKWENQIIKRAKTNFFYIHQFQNSLGQTNFRLKLNTPIATNSLTSCLKKESLTITLDEKVGSPTPIHSLPYGNHSKSGGRALEPGGLTEIYTNVTNT